MTHLIDLTTFKSGKSAINKEIQVFYGIFPFSSALPDSKNAIIRNVCAPKSRLLQSFIII